MCGNKSIHMSRPNKRKFYGYSSSTKLRSRVAAIAIFLLHSLCGHGFVCPPSNSPISYNSHLDNKRRRTYRRERATVYLPARPRKHAEGDSGESPKRRNLNGNKTDAHLEEDIAKRLSISRDRAISALSQPKPGDDEDSNLSLSNDTSNKGKNRTRNQNEKERQPDSLLPRIPTNSKDKNYRTPSKPYRKQHPNAKRRRRSPPKDSFSSLLPPPIQEKGKRKDSKFEDDALANGLSSWEDFLGSGTRPNRESVPPPLSQTPIKKGSFSREAESKKGRQRDSSTTSASRNILQNRSPDEEKLPSITDLFPPDFSSTLRKSTTSARRSDSSGGNRRSKSSSPTLDGVLPVSDLFYRSAQSMNDEVADNENYQGTQESEESDDEELPFSAEQSDQLMTDHNKIKIRRNQAKTYSPSKPPPRINQPGRSSKRKSKSPPGSRKMVRRGMEMLVGGVPINADPPQRYLDLTYQRGEGNKWYDAISINSRDFGPMYHASSIELLSPVERGLFCEHFVHSTIKWDVCPKDLKTLVKSYQAFGDRDSDSSKEETYDKDSSSTLSDNATEDTEPDLELEMLDLMAKSLISRERSEGAGQGFGKPSPSKKTSSAIKGSRSRRADGVSDDARNLLGGELVFSVGISREELETGNSKLEGSILERVLSRGITIATEPEGFAVRLTKLKLTEMDDGTTMISGEFILEAEETMSLKEMEQNAHRINASLAQAMDDGDMQLAMAAAAKEELGWPESIRDRVVEEFLFEDDDGDEPLDDDNDVEGMGSNTIVSKLLKTAGNSNYDETAMDATVNSLKELNGKDDGDYDGPFGMPGSSNYHHDDIFLGGGNDGVFWDYSDASKLSSPYGGDLGLRLVDAVVEREKARQPRVIAIGDVHGCIDELQDLLRQCDYRPGDLVVFLGDLVSKGPDSISVVKMAREIGAIGVRGNHDFEVIRWHQAIKSGVDPPVVGSEHFHIASCLSKGDMKWMYSLPWYISSKELGALFVHAGFVSGIRLAKQNPRLMMNMRSILPDGTVTSKFFNNWPWARLWDGPQTVLFGHDADRGLQQYEHAIGLDTGCVYGGRLTACILPEKRLVSVGARREYFKYRRKHYD